jgi:hypothetical protein
MRSLAAVAALLIALSLGAAAAATRPRAPIGFPNVPGNWSHAEINVTVAGVPHTLILDRGKIVQVSPQQVQLREHDGTSAVIPLSTSTIVTLNGRPSSPFLLRKKMTVETLRVDGGAATRVRATR